MSSATSFSISCDDCTLRCSTSCDECVVTFVLHTEDQIHARGPDAFVFDLDQQRVIRWMSRAGLVPDLRYEQAG